MKAIFRTALLVLLLAVTSSPCYAMRSIGIITKAEAKAMGLEVRFEGNGPQVWVALEFNPEGKLKDFKHVELEINDGDKFLLGYTPLRERRLASGRILVQFLADRAFVDKLTLCIVAGLDAGQQIRVKDFVEPKKAP